MHGTVPSFSVVGPNVARFQRKETRRPIHLSIQEHGRPHELAEQEEGEEEGDEVVVGFNLLGLRCPLACALWWASIGSLLHLHLHLLQCMPQLDMRVTVAFACTRKRRWWEKGERERRIHTTYWETTRGVIFFFLEEEKTRGVMVAPKLRALVTGRRQPPKPKNLPRPSCPACYFSFFSFAA